MADSGSEAALTFKNAKTLTVSEVALLLQEHVQVMRQDNPDYQPNQLLAKTLDYTQQFSSNKNKETLEKIREALHRKDFTQEEIAMVSSLELGTSEEAKKLVPSLERYSDEELDAVLGEVATYRAYE